MYLSFCSIDPTRKIRAKPDMKSITFKSLYQSALLSILQLKNNNSKPNFIYFSTGWAGVTLTSFKELENIFERVDEIPIIFCSKQSAENDSLSFVLPLGSPISPVAPPTLLKQWELLAS